MVGEMLRSWRQRRRLSQLDLACQANISTRHVSFLETGRSRPSREMLLRLAEQLEIPLRARNALLLAAGFAPEYPERSLDDPAVAAGRRAVELVLKAHEPNPAIAVDRHWNLAASNAAIGPFLAGVPEQLLAPPANVLRLSLHPEGLAGRIVNLAQWRHHLLHRLRQQVEATADPVLMELATELEQYPPGPPNRPESEGDGGYAGVAIPFRIRVDGGVMSFLSTTTIFGTPVDITLAELAIESFFPADEATAAALMRPRT